MLGPPMDMAMYGERQNCDQTSIGAGRKPIISTWSCSSVASLLFGIGCLLATGTSKAADTQPGIFNPIHGYDTRPVNDRFTQFLNAWDSGQKPAIDTSGDLPFLRSL